MALPVWCVCRPTRNACSLDVPTRLPTWPTHLGMSRGHDDDDDDDDGDDEILVGQPVSEWGGTWALASCTTLPHSGFSLILCFSLLCFFIPGELWAGHWHHVDGGQWHMFFTSSMELACLSMVANLWEPGSGQVTCTREVWCHTGALHGRSDWEGWCLSAPCHLQSAGRPANILQRWLSGVAVAYQRCHASDPGLLPGLASGR